MSFASDRAARRGFELRRALPMAPRLTLKRRAQLFHIALLIPALLVTVAFVGWPIVKLVQISFHELRLAELMRPITKPMSLANYQRALGHPDLPHVLMVTAVFTLAGTAGAFVLGLASALALGAMTKARALVRVIIVSPWAVAPVIASLIWAFMLDERVGLINAAIVGARLSSLPIPFLSSPDWALLSVTLVGVWKEYPFFAVMLIAALQSVPVELYEAARLDGAGPLRMFRAITWPLIRPVAAVAVFLSLLSSFRNVETILVLTGGGPARSTETLAVRVYTETFRFLSPGTGAALGMLTLMIGLAAALVFWSAIRARPR
ncbi:MAG: carbohydrate ABC transporter permease [Elsteraceae bacterium]